MPALSFVPVTGPATFRAGEPPRTGVVEFSDERRTISLPIRAALPVLSKAHARDDLHPSVGLLSGAALLALRLVAAGRLEPDPSAPGWRMSTLDAADIDRIRMLARSRASVDLVPDEAEALVRQVLDAVADAMPRSAPAARPLEPHGGPGFSERLQARLDQRRVAAPDALPHLVRISLRVEADEEELVAGAVRLVLQVHDEHNPLHVSDAAVLWAESGADASHGFGERARTHATIALRGAAEAWPVLDRLLELRVPDQITLDTDELVSLLEHGVGALQARGVDVLWPRSLGRDLTATAVLDRAERPNAPGSREEPLATGLFGPDALFAFNWQVALHGDPLTRAELDELTSSASPILKLRGNWTVIDPAIARKARKRLIRTVRPVQAVAATLTGVAQVDDLEEQVVVGASLLRGPRTAPDGGHQRADLASTRAAGDAARLPAARTDLAGRAHLTRPRCLPRRRHGPRQDGHHHRPAPAPPGCRVVGGTQPARRWSCVPPRCWATGRTRSRGSPPAYRCGGSTVGNAR